MYQVYHAQAEMCHTCVLGIHIIARILQWTHRRCSENSTIERSTQALYDVDRCCNYGMKTAFSFITHACCKNKLYRYHTGDHMVMSSQQQAKLSLARQSRVHVYARRQSVCQHLTMHHACGSVPRIRHEGCCSPVVRCCMIHAWYQYV